MDTFLWYPKSIPDQLQVAGISACRRCFSVIHQKNVMTFLGILRYVWCLRLWEAGNIFQHIRNLELDVTIVAYRKWFAEHFKCMSHYRHTNICISYDMICVLYLQISSRSASFLSTTFTRCIGMCFLVRRMSFPLVRRMQHWIFGKLSSCEEWSG